MIKKTLVSLLMGLILMGAVPPTDYDKRLSQIVVAFSKKAEEERGLYTTRTGGGMPNDINRFGITLRACYILPIEEARKLYVELFEELKAIINRDPYIRPLLCEFPYPNKGVDLMLGFESKQPVKTDVYLVLHVDGMLYYYNSSRQIVFEEPYADALKLMQATGNRAISEERLNIFASEALSSIPLSKPPKKVYRGPNYSVKAQEAFDKLADTIAKEKKWDYLRQGRGLLVKGKKTEWSVIWASNEQVNLDQGRKMAVQLQEWLWNHASQNPVFGEYLKASAQHYKETNYKNYHLLETEFKPYMLGFRIDFWDRSTNRYKAPYLAQIRLADNTFYFHYADPDTQALQEPIVETVQEAYEKVHSIGGSFDRF